MLHVAGLGGEHEIPQHGIVTFRFDDRQEMRLPQVDHDDIRQFSGFQRPNVPVHAEQARAFDRAHANGFFSAERGRIQTGDLLQK